MSASQPFHRSHDYEKHQINEQQVHEVERGSFTPLVFSALGSISIATLSSPTRDLSPFLPLEKINITLWLLWFDADWVSPYLGLLSCVIGEVTIQLDILISSHWLINDYNCLLNVLLPVNEEILHVLHKIYFCTFLTYKQALNNVILQIL